MKQKFCILHLSDLHFGEIAGRNFKHQWDYPGEGLVAKCHQALKAHDISPNVVVISGDLICDGSVDAQYSEAKEHLLALCAVLELTSDRIIIVPGNHDLDRTETDDRSRLLKFRGVLEGVYTDAPLRSRIPPRTWDSHEKNVYDGWNPVVTFKDIPVEFVLLYSCFTRKGKLVPVHFKNTLNNNGTCLPELETEAWSLFDRGFVSNEQLGQLSFPGTGTIEKPIRIAIVHHNLIPIPRDFHVPDELGHPDANLLTNGMEVVETLIEKGVALILHGHRHQWALTVRSQKDGTKYLTVLGAPTAGLKNERHLGFNVVDIVRHNLGWGAKIRKFEYSGNGQICFKPVSGDPIEIEFYPQKPAPYRLLSNRHAVKTLADKLLRSHRGPTILHFTAWANWHKKNRAEVSPDKVDPTSSDSPFAIVWDNDKEKRYHLTRILFSNPSPNQREIDTVRDWILKSEKQGYYDEEFRNRLTEKAERFRFGEARGNDDAFLSDVFSLPDDTSNRKVNYAIELFRLATDPMFAVTKAVHLCPSTDGEGEMSDARAKFLWLVNSALACRGLNNCNLAWMPFCFQKGFNQTLVAVDDGSGGRADPANIMIGWGPGDRPGEVADPDLTNEFDYSVMVWNEDHPVHSPLGDFGRDVRGLYERIIHPLSHRLMKDFPVLKDGRVYWKNIETIATALNYNAELKIVEEYLAKHSDEHLNKDDQTISVDKLKKLFQWILSQADIRWLSGNNEILPWCEGDLIKMNLNLRMPTR